MIFILAGEERGELHFFDKLISVMERLRGPEGCPWDREQKLPNLRSYIVEEAYELAEAISEGSADNICEESGDLLLQIVFAASIAKEMGLFGIEDVVKALHAKLVRRHPHVFTDAQAADSTEVIRNWERIKREEREGKKEDPSILAGIPKGLPPLLKAHQMQGKVAHVGFDWFGGDPTPLFDKLAEETEELRQAVASGGEEAVEEELGDLLFMVVNLARHLDVNPDAALSRSCAKFATRFRRVEEDAAARGLRLNECSPKELDVLWHRAKKSLKV